MIYVSHLLCDEDMKEICGQYGAGVESIEFSISDNLDRLERKMEQYQKDWSRWEIHRLPCMGHFWT